MSAIEKYDTAFIEAFDLKKEQLGEQLIYQSVPLWDSLGHMNLISAIENAFGIVLDTDDIVNFSSYTSGKNILSKYNLKFN